MGTSKLSRVACEMLGGGGTLVTDWYPILGRVPNPLTD